MARETELIDVLADFLGMLSDPKRFGARTLEMTVQIEGARAGAIFKVRGSDLTLFVSHRLDQEALELASSIWTHHRAKLEKGESVLAPRRARQAARTPAVTAFVATPVMNGDVFVGFIYLDNLRSDARANEHVARLRKLATIVSSALVEDSVSDYLERTSLAEIEKRKLLLLLEHNQWNLSRVAQLMGTTRATIYERLQRFGIKREKRRKTRMRPAWI